MAGSNKLVMRVAYQWIGKYFEPRLSNFESLKRDLRRAGIDISLRMYLSMSVFQAMIGFVSSLLLMVVLKIVLPTMPLAFIIIIPIIVSISMFFVRLAIPSTKISERKRKLESSLPTAASYMAAMSSAGVNPDQIFFSLSSDELDLFVSHDAKKISRDINIFGLDIIRSLENASLRSPSPKYTSFLEGINATNTSGGDLQSYFENASKALMRDKVQDEKGYIEVLGLFAELFLVACIVTPTFGIIFIAMIGLQSTMTHTSLMTIVLGMAFLMIPILQAMIIILVDGSQPMD